MPKYSHVFSIAFTVNSDHPLDAVTADEMRAALERRIADIDSEGDLAWPEAALHEDTVEEDA